MVRKNRNFLIDALGYRLSIFLVCLFVSWLLPAPLGGGGISYAGQLLFDGVPVDITTSANEDLVIVPGAGGNTQIGDATGTNTNATSNDDLHITGILEVDGNAYFDSAATFASSFNPSADSTADLGSSTLAWRYIYVDTISGYNAALALNPASGYSLTGSVTKNTATGNEVAYDLAATINKATSGNYTGLKLDVTETSAPGSADKLLDLLVGGVSRFQVYNGANSANYGLVSIGRDDWDGSTTGFFAGSANGTQLAINAITGFTGNLMDAQVAGTSMFSVDANGNVTAAGTITGAGSALSGTTANTFEIDTDDSSTTPTLTFGANVAAVPHIQTQVGNLHVEPAGATVINDGTIGTAAIYATAAGELYVENDFETRGKSYHFDDILLGNQKSFAVLDGSNNADYNHSIMLDQTSNVMYFKEWTTFTWTNTSPATDVDIMTLTPTTGLNVLNDDALNNNVTDVLTIRHTTTGAPAATIGVGQTFHVEDAGGVEEQGSIDVLLTTVTDAAEDADMVFQINQVGTISEIMRLDGSADTVTISGGGLLTLGASNQLAIDGATTDSTTTTGVINLDVDSLTNNNVGMDLDYETTGATVGATNYAQKVSLTQSATVARTLYGYYLTAADTSALASTLTGIYIDVTTANAGDTVSAATLLGGKVEVGAGTTNANATGAGDLYVQDALEVDGTLYTVATSATGAITATNFISNVATGTQPYACTSTTVNASLNADMLDGKHTGTSGNVVPLMDGTNTWSGANKINVNSATALFVEQDTVKDNVLVVDTANGRVGVNTAPTVPLDVNGNVLIGGTTPKLTIGDAGAEDTALVFDGNAQDYIIGLDDTDDSLQLGTGSTLPITSGLYMDTSGRAGFGATTLRGRVHIADTGDQLIIDDSDHVTDPDDNIWLFKADSGQLTLLTADDGWTNWGTVFTVDRTGITADSFTLSTPLILAGNNNLTFNSGTGSLVMTNSVSNASDKVIDVTPAFAGGATDALTYTVVDVAAFTANNPTGTDTVNALSVGNLTETVPATITSTALKIGTGWDAALTVGGTTVLNSTGQLVAGTQLTGLVPLANGGTNANLTASNGGIFYSTASAGAILSGTATANQALLSGSSTTPAWSTATYPATTTADQILYSSAANTIAGLATANSGVLVTSGAGVPSISSTLPAVSLAADANLTFTSGTGSLVMTNSVSNASDKVIDVTPAFAGGATDALTYTVVDVAAFTANNPTGTDTVNALSVGNLTETVPATITSTALKIGTGWDAALTVGGTTVLNSTGQLVAGTQLTGLVPLANGGTNANLTASNGGIFYSTASAGAILSGTATANQVLLSGSSTTPAWSTATYPATTTVSQILYSSATNTIAGLATANSGVLVTSGTGVPSISSTLPATIYIGDAGQYIGLSGSDLAFIETGGNWMRFSTNASEFHWFSDGATMATELMQLQADGDLKVTKNFLLPDGGEIKKDDDDNHRIKFDQSGDQMEFYEFGTFDWYYATPNPDVMTMRLSGTAGLTVLNDDATASGVTDILTIQHTTTGVAAAGIGTGLSFQVEDGGGNQEHGSIDTVLDVVTNGSEQGTMIFKVNKAGTMTEILRLDGTAGLAGIGVGGEPAAKLEVNPGSADGIGLQIDQDDVDQTALDIDTANTSGDIINLDWAGATTQAAAQMSGLNLDFTNFTSLLGQNIYGIMVNDLAAQTTATEYGIYQEGTNWDYGIYADDAVYIAGTLTMASAIQRNVTGGRLDLYGSTDANTGARIEIYDDTDTSDEGRLRLIVGDGNGVIPGGDADGFDIMVNNIWDIILSIDVTGVAILDSGMTINEDGDDADTRIEGDTDTTLLVCDAGLDKVMFGTNSSSATSKIEVLGADNAIAAIVKINALQANINASDTFIDFRSTTGSEGSVAGTATLGLLAYNTFTGSHWTKLDERQGLEPNILLEATGEKFNDGKGQLVKSKICKTKKSKAVYGIYGGTDKDGNDMVLALGSGYIWVVNKGEDVEIGDYLTSSDTAGCAEKQDDDLLHNYTVAKALEPIKWKDGEAKKLIACTLHAG